MGQTAVFHPIIKETPEGTWIQALGLPSESASFRRFIRGFVWTADDFLHVLPK